MEPFKNVFSLEFVNSLALEISKVDKNFEVKNFTSYTLDEDFDNKELKERMRHISQSLKNFLPNSYKKSIEILMKITPSFNGLATMVLPDYVEVYGLNDLRLSIKALETFTKYGSSEFGVRPFLIKYPDEMIEQMCLWSKSNNVDVRRLASEGIRPRLPWAMSLPFLKKDPTKIIPILENLKDDESEYVRKSVANNINDISKDHPNLVLCLMESWIGANKNRDWIVKHACRTLLKMGNSRALFMFGYTKPNHIQVSKFEVDEKVILGQILSFSCELRSSSNLGKLRVEFAIYFMKKNNKLSKKVFKISESTCNKSSKIIHKSFSFKKITTRVYYAGIHEMAIIVNGQEYQKMAFLVEQDDLNIILNL
ncbi:MAG: DNA alkylation repair protein [Candidatus Cloacimonadota bacterium]|nr:MAG: DNA alkylation repair protein [Candidatus Cloacimonadota bacterium]PCJ21014.1 MAG: DNA alkylation repair protein [Candidatus Cloacimonadota bacterium]